MEYSYQTRRGRGSRKQESNIVSRVIRPRHDTLNTRIFQTTRQSHGEKPYDDSRPEFEVGPGPGRRHTYANDRRSSREIQPPLKPSNIVAARDHIRGHRQYGRQPVQSRQSLPLPLPHMYDAIEPEIFRHGTAVYNSRYSIISSGSGGSRVLEQDLPLPREKILRTLPQAAPAACSSSCDVVPVPPTGLRNFKHKLFTQFRSDASSEEDLKEFPRAPTTQMMEIQLSYVMARQHESSVMLTHQMDGIRESIEKELETLSPNRGEALTPEAVHHLFDLCEYLKLSDPVKYTAIEIYDRFMMAFSGYMADQLVPLDNQTTMEAHQRLKTQALLRLGTCVQLASKMVADVSCNVLSSNAIHNALNFQPFTVKGISASELRVLSLIKYRTHHVTTLDIIEILLIQLELDIPLYRRIYEFSVFLLDYILEFHEAVYNCLFKLAMEKQPTLDRTEFRKIEFNKLVEASGIVACCVYAFKQTEYKIYQHAISSITKVNESTFTDLAAILLKNTTDQALWPEIS